MPAGSDPFFTNAQPAQQAKAPDPWNVAPYNGNIDAWMADEVRSGRNFSTWLQRPEAAQAYERYRSGVDAQQAARMASPEYQDMVRRANEERQQKQERALASTGSGFSPSNIVRAAAGTIGAPVIVARQTPGLSQALPYLAPGADATQQVTQAAADAALPGGSGLTREQGGAVNRTLDRAGVVNSPDQGDSPYTANTGGAAPVARAAASGAPATGYQVGEPIDVSGQTQTARDAVAGGQALVDQAVEGAGQAGENLGQAGEDRVGQYEANAAELLSNQTRAIQELYGDAFSNLDDLVEDPNVLRERALAQQLAAASATPGGAAAQRGAMFEAAQNAPALNAQVNEDVRQQKVARSQMFNELTQSMTGAQLAVMQGGLAASDTALRVLQQYDITGEQLDSSERMWLGNLGRDLQNIWQANEQAWAGLDQNERLARLELEMKRYGIDRQFDAVMQQIAAGQQFTWKDFANGVLGLTGAYVSGR